MKVYIDSDIILDVIFKRPEYDASAKVISLCEKGIINGYTSSLILANCYYIIRSKNGHKNAISAISSIREILEILDFTNKAIGESIQSGFSDFEDGIQNFIALNNSINIFLTRNIEDYKKSSLQVMTPNQFLVSEKLKIQIRNAV